MIHCDISGDISSQINYTIGVKWSYDLMYFFSNIIGRFSVPMFFLISGFLFFRRGTLTHKQYVTKLHNRLYTLLIPYLVWNLIGFLYFAIKHYPPLCSVFQGVAEIPITLSNFLKAFWEFRFEGVGESKSMPIDFPLWYIRDLMVVVLCSPILYKLIRLGSLPVILLGILWFAFNMDFIGIEMTGFFFFTLGGYIAVYNIDIVNIIEPKCITISIALLFLILVIVNMLTRSMACHHFIHKITILTGMVFIFRCAVFSIKSVKLVDWLNRLVPSTFFIYALHGLFVATLRKMLVMVLQPNTNAEFAIVYALSIFSTILLSLICYYALKRLCPKICLLLNGGR